jgi:PDZ domain
VLLMDTDVIRRVTGRDVLGLAGQRVFAGRALWIDYYGDRIICVPSPPESLQGFDSGPGDSSFGIPDSVIQAHRARRSRELLSPLLSPQAHAIPFRLAGDNKMLVDASFPGPGTQRGKRVTLVFDTGATKSCLFEPLLTDSVPASKQWRSLTGIVAPTLLGNASARLAIAPAMELVTTDPRHPLRRKDVDCAIITSDLSDAISAAVGEPVAGLLGYSFFKGDRVAIDYPNRTLWLDPDPRARDDHPFEYSHVGIQLERSDDCLRVVGIAGGSPAEAAGIMVGDTLVSVASQPARGDGLIEMSRLLEGAAGTRIRIVLRRDGVPRTYRLVRRRLL